MGCFRPERSKLSEGPLPGCVVQPRNDLHGRIPEVLPAVFDGRLRLQSGFWEVVQASVYGVHALILCGQLHRPNVFQDSPKIRHRRKAHGSIRVQEGEPKRLSPAECSWAGVGPENIGRMAGRPPGLMGAGTIQGPNRHPRWTMPSNARQCPCVISPASPWRTRHSIARGSAKFRRICIGWPVRSWRGNERERPRPEAEDQKGSQESGRPGATVSSSGHYKCSNSGIRTAPGTPAKR